MPVTSARAHPAFLADHHGHRFVHNSDFGHYLLVSLNKGATRVGKGFGVRLNFFHHQAAQGGRAAQNFFQLLLLVTQVGQLLFYLDGLQARELAQANFQNVFGLPLGELEALHQCRLGLVGAADDGNDLVDVEQHQLATFQNVNAVQHLAQPVARTLLNGADPKRNPLHQHLP